MNKVKEAIKTVVDRYGTADPFKIAEYLNIDVRWSPLGARPLGKTNYDDLGPIVMLNNCIRDSQERYFVLAHELGHVILQEGLSGYYTGAYFGHDKLENQANEFAIGLIGMLYVEDNDRVPDTIYELEKTYGVFEEN